MRTLLKLILAMPSVAVLAQAPAASTTPDRWSEQQANERYKAQPSLAGGTTYLRAPSTTPRHQKPRGRDVS